MGEVNMNWNSTNVTKSWSYNFSHLWITWKCNFAVCV